MKKILVRANNTGSAKILCTADEFSLNGKTLDGVKLYPVLYFDEPDFLKCIIVSEQTLSNPIGFNKNQLSHFKFID